MLGIDEFSKCNLIVKSIGIPLGIPKKKSTGCQSRTAQ